MEGKPEDRAQRAQATQKRGKYGGMKRTARRHQLERPGKEKGFRRQSFLVLSTVVEARFRVFTRLEFGWQAAVSFFCLPDSSRESAPRGIGEQLLGDILVRRNAHLLEEIQAELPRAGMIVVPWGAAHMRGIAGEIQKSGFHLSSSQEYSVVSFQHVWNCLTHSNNK